VLSLPDVPIRLHSHVGIRACSSHQVEDTMVANRDYYNVCKKSFHGIQKFIKYCDYSDLRFDSIQRKKSDILHMYKYLKCNPITGLEGSRRLRLPDFKTIST
jgi:hypothetical protein